MDQSAVLSSFMELTQTSESEARRFLEETNYDLESAIASFFQDRTGSAPAPSSILNPSSSSLASAPSSANSKKQKTSSKFKSFRDLREEDDDEVEDDKNTNLFTGGEESGLQVENPDKRSKNSMGLVQDLLKKAEEEGQKAAPERQEVKKPKFLGSGFKLGSIENNIETQEYQDAKAKKSAPEPVTRKITFWKEGFQVEDGELLRYDDPANAEHLRVLNQGRAPLSLLNVQMFQEVQVDVEQRLEESFVPPKRKIGGFSGSGQRLGSPVPGEPITIDDSKAVIDTSATKVETKAVKENEAGEGDAKIQIRLANGKRIVYKANPSDSVQSVFDYVSANTSDQRDWLLAFPLPLKVIEDKTQSIKEAGLINSVIVQRWT